MSARKKFMYLLFLSFFLLFSLLTGSGDSTVKAEGISFSNARPSKDGWLHTSGTYIVNESEEKVILRGISTHGLTWYPDYINEPLFEDISVHWNCNMIRLAMYTSEYVKDSEGSWDLMIQGIDAAIAADMYVLADWHILDDYDPNINRKAAEDFFERLSKRYADCPNVLYEICNEPNGSATWKDIKDYSSVIIPIIRSNSPDSMIIVGTPEYDQNLKDPMSSPLDFDNVLYSYHFYSASHYGKAQNVLKEAIDSGLPVFISECGVTEASGDGDVDFENAADWFTYLHDNGISYAIWNLSNKQETSSFIKATSSHTKTLTEEDLTPVGQWVRELLLGIDPYLIQVSGEQESYGFLDYFKIQFNALGTSGLKPMKSWIIFAPVSIVIILTVLFGAWVKKKKKGAKFQTYDDIQTAQTGLSNLHKHWMRNRIVIVLSGFFTLVYLFWRICWTLPLQYDWLGTVFSIALLIVECFGFVESMIFYRNMMNVKDHPLPTIKEEDYPEVDIFISTYNEPESLLRKTINGCKHLKYPDNSKVHIWVCDDNHRSSMKQLAESMGVGYFDRDDHIGQKAGNLNHAMGLTSAPYIVTLDADMIVRSEFLMKTIPYFVEVENACRDLPEEEKVHLGLLQTPQCFYDPDVFQYALYSENNIPNEQDFFYRTIEVGKTSTNSVIYGGSNTVLSRRALEDIGGFYTESITEDFATGLLIESAGYLSLGLSEPLASGMTPNTYREHIQQRVRWGRGVINTARKLKILSRKELRLEQRLSYWSSEVYWYSPVKHMIYIISPLLFAAFNIMVFRCTWVDLLVYWLPMFVMQDVCLRFVSGNAVSSKWSGVYETSVMPHLLIPIVKEFLGISLSTFKVTDKTKKGTQSGDYKAMAPFIILLVLSVFAVIRLLVTVKAGSYLSVAILLFWIIRNMYYLIMALFLIDGRDSDGEPVKVKDGELVFIQRNEDAKRYEGITTVLTEHSVKVLLDESQDLMIGDRIQITIQRNQAEAVMEGVVTERIKSKYNEQCVHMIEIIDYGTDELEYLQMIYDRIPTLPQSLTRDIGILPGIWRNLIRHANSE